MIHTEAQLGRAQEAVAQLERALAALELDRSVTQAERFTLMAEPILDDLQCLRADIDRYLGSNLGPSTMSPPLASLLPEDRGALPR